MFQMIFECVLYMFMANMVVLFYWAPISTMFVDSKNIVVEVLTTVLYVSFVVLFTLAGVLGTIKNFL